MNILMMILRSPRPSRQNDMRAVAMPRWIRKGYDGLTFFGHIITHNAEEAEAFNACHTLTCGSKNGMLYFKNHEMIHLYQARATHDSWLCFYWQYMLFWLKARGYRRHLKNAGYKLNPFEMEAYANMDNLDYLKPGGKAEGWKRYAAMTLEERLKAYQKEILKR